MSLLQSIADAWIARRAAREPAAIAAIAGLAPGVVVTGGSRGIGQAIAGRFAAAGQTVLLVARSPEHLARAAEQVRAGARDARVLTLALDVTDADAHARIVRRLADEGLYLDVLVNNAAMGLGGLFADHEPGAVDALVALNVGALTRLTRAVLPDMLARGRGGIINVASLGGYVPGPYQAAYYASKAYVLSLSEALAAEAAGSGVRITVVAPGPVDTGFHAAMGADRALYRLVVPDLSPERVAAAAHRGHLLGLAVVRPGLVAPLASVLVRLLPHAITVPIVAWLLKPGDSPRHS